MFDLQLCRCEQNWEMPSGIFNKRMEGKILSQQWKKTNPDSNIIGFLFMDLPGTTWIFFHNRLMDQIFFLANENSVFLSLPLCCDSVSANFLLLALYLSLQTACHSQCLPLHLLWLASDYINWWPEFPTFWPSGTWSWKWIIDLFIITHLLFFTVSGWFETLTFWFY